MTQPNASPIPESPSPSPELNAGVLLAEVAAAPDSPALEQLRVSLLGKKGSISLALKALGQATPEMRKTRGAELNRLKQALNDAIDARARTLELEAESEKLRRERVDVTLAARPSFRGTVHPITQVMDEIAAIFASLGFGVRTGPLLEDDDHNFTHLNIPESHPARQMHDTFYVRNQGSGVRDQGQENGEPEAEKRTGSRPPSPNPSYLLRTHTSPVQVRTMQSEKPPIRIIAPGATFRCDSDQTHTPMFHQVEALLIDRDIHMGHLRGCINAFLERFFGVEIRTRFRPSFFPFTEPSAEVDVGCARGKDSIKIGQGDDWLEIMGCGMVHPKVLVNCGIDPQQWQGFAFGVGVERLAMLKYNIPDLRTFFESDARWLAHYGFGPLDIPGAFGG